MSSHVCTALSITTPVRTPSTITDSITPGDNYPITTPSVEANTATITGHPSSLCLDVTTRTHDAMHGVYMW